MALPSALLQAVSARSGGQIALVVGAGCSVDPPTSLPTAREMALEVHRCLVDDRVLNEGDCTTPEDLSRVADAVWAKTSSQSEMVKRLRQRYVLKLAPPNKGYRIAAALLCEGAVTSVITLNFDLALSNAIPELCVGDQVGVIESPAEQADQKNKNIYYLHGSVNAEPDSWVLRTVALDKEWKDSWISPIATKVLSAPFAVFAGLGTPVAVLIESTKLLRSAFREKEFFQVDLGDKEQSAFFQALGLDESQYIQCGWCDFMGELSDRLVKEHVAQLREAVEQKVQQDGLRPEEVQPLLDQLLALGLIEFGELRSDWLLHSERYTPFNSYTPGLLADLLLALAMMERISGTQAAIGDRGLVEFRRDGRVVTAFLVASGRGHRKMSALEAEIARRERQCRNSRIRPQGGIVGGTSDIWIEEPSTPKDILHGETRTDDIVVGPGVLRLFHISRLRDNPTLVRGLLQ